MKPRQKNLESPFGWEAGLEYEKLQQKKAVSLPHKMRTFVLIAASLLGVVAIYWLFSPPEKQGTHESKAQSEFDVPLVNPAVLKPKGSYEAAKQLYQYVELFSGDVAKELSAGVKPENLTRRNGIQADINLLAENATGATDYFYMRIAVPISQMRASYGSLTPINGLFGLGARRAGEALNEHFSYGMTKDDYIAACINLPDGFNDSLRKSCRIAVFYREFMEHKYPYTNIAPYITSKK